ncbi:hypothetical protein ABBQ32_013048 [Trebouxia sp. C0010 RCD-2024]
MLGRELENRANKLVRESKERAEKAKRQAEKERIVRQRQDERQRQFEEQKRQQRLAEEAAAEAERLKHDEDLETNNGVWWQERLMAVPLEANVAEQLGIKRSTDKIRLPKSAGDALMSQDAPKNGAMLFELATSAGRSVHAGVLDFSATLGTVAVPAHLIRNLWGLTTCDGQCHGDVIVTYRRLPKGTYVRFQPRSAGFQEAVGESVEQVLQASMFTHSTLTQGEWVQVQHAGTLHDLKVLALKPQPAVSIIETDLEAEVDPSVETEEKLRAEEEAAQQRLQAMQRAEEEAIKQAMQDANLREQAQADREKIRQEKAALLPPEPSSNAEGPIVSCLFRMPDGTRASRVFLQSQPAKMLFDFADAKGAGGLPFGGYRLVMQFPRRVINAASVQTQSIAEAGLTSPQEVLLLEAVHQAELDAT